MLIFTVQKQSNLLGSSQPTKQYKIDNNNKFSQSKHVQNSVQSGQILSQQLSSLKTSRQRLFLSPQYNKRVLHVKFLNARPTLHKPYKAFASVLHQISNLSPSARVCISDTTPMLTLYLSLNVQITEF